MQKWEEQQRKKNYKKMLRNAKSSNLVPSSKKHKSKKAPSQESTPIPTAPFSPSTASSMAMTQSELAIAQKAPAETLIFKLLSGFNLQQYAKSFIEAGIVNEVYKLALINQREKRELLASMKLLPGHAFKFEDMFEFIQQVYPREDAKHEISSKTHYGRRLRDLDEGLDRRVPSAKVKPIHNKSRRKRKTLMTQYESLDLETRDVFNRKFLEQLEERGGVPVGQMLEEFVDETESQGVAEAIFPPEEYGNYNQVFDYVPQSTDQTEEVGGEEDRYD